MHSAGSGLKSYWTSENHTHLPTHPHTSLLLWSEYLLLGPLLGYRHIPSHYTKCHIIILPCHLFLFLMVIWQDVGVAQYQWIHLCQWNDRNSSFCELYKRPDFVKEHFKPDTWLFESIFVWNAIVREWKHTDLSLCLIPFERRELDERFYPIKEEGRLSSATPQRAFCLLFWGMCFIFTRVQLVLCCITLMHKNGDSLPLELIYPPPPHPTHTPLFFFFFWQSHPNQFNSATAQSNICRRGYAFMLSLACVSNMLPAYLCILHVWKVKAIRQLL